MDLRTPGRNEPCPCGSRIKCKRCCGLDDAWVPGLGYVPTLARRCTLADRMLVDAIQDPSLLESPARLIFCEAPLLHSDLQTPYAKMSRAVTTIVPAGALRNSSRAQTT